MINTLPEQPGQTKKPPVRLISRFSLPENAFRAVLTTYESLASSIAHLRTLSKRFMEILRGKNHEKQEAKA